MGRGAIPVCNATSSQVPTSLSQGPSPLALPPRLIGWLCRSQRLASEAAGTGHQLSLPFRAASGS
ncbi:hypothetical protein CCUS01_06933 [Colletotrichum cuscutae]|uniref:Uncharacterized protein n=1 Tax=Colletotrichum cuscutae TaxID=1209917 RepID=A0AAI9V3C3_9PEZI|nr:hypothetical protein CCUS01_06933 [Colletotrichum cuscutae]